LVFNGKYGIKKSKKCKQNSIVDTFVLVPKKGWVKFHLEQACGCCVMPSKQFVSYITARTSHTYLPLKTNSMEAETTLELSY
jgi:hypothetical protein